MWGLCESELSDMLNKGGRGSAAPQCTADTLSEDTRTTCPEPGPSRQVRRQKLYAFRPMHQDDTSHQRLYADGDETRPDDGCSGTALSVPAAGAGCVGTVTSPRGGLNVSTAGPQRGPCPGCWVWWSRLDSPLLCGQGAKARCRIPYAVR